MTFKEDRLKNEKNEPVEASSLAFINVPLVLLALFLGFGITYLALRTDNTSMSPGDSRTTPTAAAPESVSPGGATDLASLMEKGKQVYTNTCQACHQATGSGIPGAFPPLIESEWANGSSKQFVAIVLHGLQGEITVKGQKFQGVMPPFKDQLQPEDIAAVVTYVRSSFGNKSDPVSAELVRQVKEDTKSKNDSWNGEADLKAQSWN